MKRILKDLGLWKTFLAVMILRAPFDFLNAVLGANMLQAFLRLIETEEQDALVRTFWRFCFYAILLFGYNASVWATISIKADLLLQRRLRKKLLQKLLGKDLQEVERNGAGDLITRLNNDVDKAAHYLTEPLNFMHRLIAIVNLILSSLVLLWLNALLFLAVILIMGPFFILSGILIIRKVPEHRQKAQEAFARYVNWVEPIILAGDAICVYDGRRIVLEKAEEESLEMMRANVKAHKLTALSSAVNVFSGILGYLLLLLLGNSMMGRGVEDFAELSKITQYRGEMMRSVMMVNNCQNRMRANLVGVRRVEETLNES